MWSSAVRSVAYRGVDRLVSFDPDASVVFMTTTAGRNMQAAVGLSEQERADIAARRLESLDAGDSDATGVADAWAAEIERRCAALDAGTTGTTAWEDVRRQLEAAIRRR